MAHVTPKTTEQVFDLIIIGSGLIGSAAAYHASLIEGISLCLIGPPEPKSRDDREVFGSWYDEGRICCQIGNSPTWATLAVESMKGYRNLELESGIKFYNEVGFASVFQDPKDYEQAMGSILEGGAVQVQNVSETWKQHFPFLNLPDDASVLWEKEVSGHISPRSLVKAHQKVAVENGAKTSQEIVSVINRAETSQSTGQRWEVITEGGSQYYAKAVLVCTGAYAGFKQLFHHVKPQKLPDLELRTQTVAYLRISAQEAKRLESMPSMCLEYSFENLDGAYVLPPILYPDGNWYLKLGHCREYEVRKDTLSDVSDWFKQQTGIPECVEKLDRFLRHVIPGLEVEAVHGDGCITSHTPDYEPYIDVIEDGFGVALGGNGYAAQSSPEIGRLAARLVLLGEWHTKIPRDKVTIKWKEAHESNENNS